MASSNILRLSIRARVLRPRDESFILRDYESSARSIKHYSCALSCFIQDLKFESEFSGILLNLLSKLNVLSWLGGYLTRIIQITRE